MLEQTCGAQVSACGGFRKTWAVLENPGTAKETGSPEVFGFGVAHIERTRDDIIAGIGECAREHYGDAICDKAMQGDTAAIRKIAKDWFGYQLVDDEGNAYSTLNPNEHWDYWRIEHNDKQDDWLNGLGTPTFRSDSVPDAKLIDRMVGNVITPDGIWHCHDEDDDDDGFVPSEVIGRHPDCTCVTVDLHI